MTDTNWYELADNSYKEQDFRKVIQICEEVIEKEPNEIRAYRLLGLAMAEIGLCDMGITNLEKALELDPDNHQIHEDIEWIINKKKEARNC